MNFENQKIKVLFILPALTTGGAEKALITLMNSLDRDQYEPLFLTVSDDGEIDRLIDDHIRIQSLGLKLSIGTLPKLYGHMKAIQPRIVISTMAHMNFAVLLLKPFFKNTKFVVREAITPSFFIQKRSLKSALISTLFKTLYPKADMVISPTRLVFDEFAQTINLHLKNARLLPNSIDEQALRANLKSPYDEKEKAELKLVACGRLHRQKGFDRLLEILPKCEINYDWRLDILGEGDQRAALEAQIADLNLDDYVFLRGLTQNPENYFAFADCVLLSSRYEGLPNVVLEALACGTLVIATAESGGVEEIKQAMKNDELKIVDSMSGFASQLEELKPQCKSNPSPSLLPAEFERADVINLFHQLLAELH